MNKKHFFILALVLSISFSCGSNIAIAAGSTSTDASAVTVSSTSNSKSIVPNCGKLETYKDSTGLVINGIKTPCDFNYFMILINNIINFLLFVIATPLAALIICYAGWLYLSSGGSSENISKAKKILLNLVIGYVIALAAWLIVKTILKTLGVDPSIETFLK